MTVECPGPLCIDLFCGLGGWTEGFLAEGYRVVGFDIEIRPYPAQLVIQDVLTIHGSQFKNAAVIVASPPCQKYSYLAMPWSRSKSEHSQAAKALRREWETNGPDNRLFDACFRIQREAIEAAGRYIPLIIENVRGAQPWVGRSAWNYGSFHLWGDVPALMPINLRSRKAPGQGTWFKQENGYGFAGADERKNNGGSWFNIAHNTESGFGKNPVHELAGQKVPVYSDPRRNGGKGSHLTSPAENVEKLADGLKIGGDWFSDPASTCRKHGSRSNARKMASAQIAKIPFELARHVAAVYYPRSLEQGAGQRAAAGKEER